MDYSTLYLFIAFLLLGIVILILNKFARKPSANDNSDEKKLKDEDSLQNGQMSVKPSVNDEKKVYVRPAGCCGLHDVCEKDSLISADTEIIYFEDEELDAFSERSSDTYTEEEIEIFEDILLTLKENEVGEWLKSLQLRKIELPQSVKDEALMIIAERRTVD